MGTFQDALKKWFYTSGTHEIAEGRRLCLLDANGNPVGSDTIGNVRSLAAIDKSKYVDMGLPSGTLWAKCNLGATTETGYGWYFSWGNPDAHPQGAGYDFSNANYNASAGKNIDGNLTMSQDAASMILGQNWRMPTTEQFVELLNSTNTDIIDADGNVITGTEKLTTYDNVSGLLLRSKVNGNKLFFPAAGLYNGTNLNGQGTQSRYWSTTLYGTSANAYNLYFYKNGINAQGSFARTMGLTIRPVINN